MPRVSLKRLLRGATKRAIEDLLALAGGPARIEDESGKVVLGDPSAEGARVSIDVGGAALGAIVGAGAERLARVVAHLGEREEEKLALADETLGRYKELTLLYDTSDKLSRVLDVDEVCKLIVAESRSFLHASGASIMLVDRRRNLLESIACTDNDKVRTRTLAATVGVEGRVLRTGRAEFVEDVSTTDSASEAGVCALMVAPLRSGEDVFGILRVTNDRRTAWTAGDLKLVTSLAGNAAAAISHAMLHRERLRQQALRHQIERFASPWVLEAALGEQQTGGRMVAALFCDVGDLARWVDPGLDAEELMTLVRRATTAALGALMGEGATVQLSHAEMIIGLFASEAGLAPAAQAAARAATRIVRALDRRFGGFVERSPGVAITHAELPEDDASAAFFSAVGAAAALQGHAEGRILVDRQIADVLEGNLRSLSELPGDAAGTSVYEVRA